MQEAPCCAKQKSAVAHCTNLHHAVLTFDHWQYSRTRLCGTLLSKNSLTESPERQGYDNRGRINPFTATCLPRRHSKKKKRPTKVPNLKSLRSFFPLHMITWKDVYENSKYWSRFLIIPSNILFTSVYMCTFQPGNFTGWGSEGVNVKTVWIHCVCCFCFCLFFRYNTSCKLFR